MKSASLRAHIELSSETPDMELVELGAFAMTASLRYRRPATSRRSRTPATSTASSARCCSG